MPNRFEVLCPSETLYIYFLYQLTLTPFLDCHIKICMTVGCASSGPFLARLSCPNAFVRRLYGLYWISRLCMVKCSFNVLYRNMLFPPQIYSSRWTASAGRSRCSPRSATSCSTCVTPSRCWRTRRASDPPRTSRAPDASGNDVSFAWRVVVWRVIVWRASRDVPWGVRACVTWRCCAFRWRKEYLIEWFHDMLIRFLNCYILLIGGNMASRDLLKGNYDQIWIYFEQYRIWLWNID